MNTSNGYSIYYSLIDKGLKIDYEIIHMFNQIWFGEYNQ